MHLGSGSLSHKQQESEIPIPPYCSGSFRRYSNNRTRKGQRKSRTYSFGNGKQHRAAMPQRIRRSRKGFFPFDAATEITDKPFIRDKYRRQGEKQTRTLLSEFIPRKKQGNCPAFFETFNFWGSDS